MNETEMIKIVLELAQGKDSRLQGKAKRLIRAIKEKRIRELDEFMKHLASCREMTNAMNGVNDERLDDKGRPNS